VSQCFAKLHNAIEREKERDSSACAISVLVIVPDLHRCAISDASSLSHRMDGHRLLLNSQHVKEREREKREKREKKINKRNN